MSAASTPAKTLLLQAVHFGDLDEVRALIDDGEALDAKSGTRSFTPLQAAVDSQQVEMAQLLIEAGADVNAANRRGCAALHAAAKNGDLEQFDMLVAAGANTEAETSAYGAHWHEDVTPLYIAIAVGSVDIVSRLLEAGADIEAKGKSWTPLQVAAGAQQPHIVRLLQEAGAIMDDPVTQLVVATSVGTVDDVRVLLADGVALRCCDFREFGLVRTCFWAAKGGHVDIVQLLLENGMTPADFVGGCYSLLSVAALFGHLRLVGVLLDAGFDPNDVGGRGPTPLSCAACADAHALAIAITLVKAGATVSTHVCDTNGLTFPAMSSACRNKPQHSALLCYVLSLLPARLSLSALPSSGCPDLFKLHRDSVLALLARGLFLNASDPVRDPVIYAYLARYQGRHDLVDLFKRHSVRPFTIADVPEAFIPLLTEDPQWKISQMVAMWGTLKWGCGTAAGDCASDGPRAGGSDGDGDGGSASGVGHGCGVAHDDAPSPALSRIVRSTGGTSRNDGELAPQPFNVGLPQEIVFWQMMPRNIVAIVVELCCDAKPPTYVTVR